MDEQIDVRGDGRIVLYRRSNAANGIYHVRLRIPGSNGYKRLSTKHSNRRDAEHFALNLYEELYFHVRDGGSLNAPKFSKAFDAWKKACAKKKTTLKKGSWENTIQRVEMYALEYFGDTQIDKIGKKEISSYVTWRYDNYKRKPPTEDSLKRECTALRSFFRYLHETGAIPKPPEFPRELNQKKNNRRPTFTQNEWRKIGRNLREWVKAGKQAKTLNKAQIEMISTYLRSKRNGLRNQTIFLLSVRAGLRAKEIAGVTWEMKVGHALSVEMNHQLNL